MLGPQARTVLSSSRTWNGWLWLKQTQGLSQSDGSILWPELSGGLHTWKFDLSVLLYNLYLQNRGRIPMNDLERKRVWDIRKVQVSATCSSLAE